MSLAAVAAQNPFAATGAGIVVQNRVEGISLAGVYVRH